MKKIYSVIVAFVVFMCPFFSIKTNAKIYKPMTNGMNISWKKAKIFLPKLKVSNKHIPKKYNRNYFGSWKSAGKYGYKVPSSNCKVRAGILFRDSYIKPTHNKYCTVKKGEMKKSIFWQILQKCICLRD